MVWPALNSNAGGRVNAIAKAFFDNHRRCRNSTGWSVPGGSGVVNAAVFVTGIVSHKMRQGYPYVAT